MYTWQPRGPTCSVKVDVDWRPKEKNIWESPDFSSLILVASGDSGSPIRDEGDENLDFPN